MKAIDYFIPAECRAPTYRFYQSRVLFGGILLSIVVLTVLEPIRLLITPALRSAALDTALVAAPWLGLTLLLLWAFRRFGRHVLTVQGLVFAIAAPILLAIVAIGGPSVAGVIAVLMPAVVIAFCLGGRRTGLPWITPRRGFR